MSNNQSRREFCATALATVFASATSVKAAEKKYDPGASDTEIKVGQTVPHSGPGSLYGVLGRVGEAYFQMLNEKGGINGRKIKFFTMDDAYSAPKCVEATRRLVEQEEVLALFGSLGTAPQTAVHKYLNSKGVPQLLLNTGASKWNDPKNNKWTMAGLPLCPTEARILAKHVVSAKPNAKVGILYQNQPATSGPATVTFLPSQLILGVADDLRSTGTVAGGWLGVLGATSSNSTGAVVTGFSTGSPATGYLHAGEVIIGVNSVPVRTMAELRSRVYVLAPNSPVALSVLDGSTQKVVDVMLGTSS